MTPMEMAKAATDALAQPGPPGMVMTIPKGDMVRGFPRGELLCETVRDGTVYRTYRFDPEKILLWLAKNGLIAVRRKDDTTIEVRAVTVPTVDATHPPTPSTIQ